MKMSPQFSSPDLAVVMPVYNEASNISAVLHEWFGRVIVSFCCRLLLWLVTGTYLTDPNVPYRLIRSKALRKALRQVPADFELQNIGLTFALKQGQKLAWKYFPIHFRARRGGENSINYRKIAKMGINLLRDFRRLTHEDSHTWWRPRWAWRRLAS